MIGHLDPREWVQAWDAFVSRTPAAAVATVIALALLILTALTQGILVPMIKALRGKNGK